MHGQYTCAVDVQKRIFPLRPGSEVMWCWVDSVAVVCDVLISAGLSQPTTQAVRDKIQGTQQPNAEGNVGLPVCGRLYVAVVRTEQLLFAPGHGTNRPVYRIDALHIITASVTYVIRALAGPHTHASHRTEAFMQLK